MSAQINEYNCPYCVRKSGSPGGVRFHIKLTHPDKLDEFNIKYFLRMVDKFKDENPQT